tara:strand:- start:685 stop:1269 length:585 start_codon:yes stop_codon:yes gene_type:complete
MIVHITGVLKSKDINELVIESNGIGYMCHISNNTFNQLPEIGKNFQILTYLHITENKHTLYGFFNAQERKLFKMLISVSGIGPKIGIQLLSSTNTEHFSAMIINSDVKMLSSLPGIGPKTAQRLIIELKDKFTITTSHDIPVDKSINNHQDAYSALIQLGYNNRNIESAIYKITKDIKDIKTEELIKLCLKELR